MSGTNANCHVSNKWEDTGGSDNPECVATDLLIRDSNDVSLQELIETELALRSSAAAVATVNKKLICDMEDATNESNLLLLAESSSAEPPAIVNGCSKAAAGSIKHRVSNVTEVDDFDVLYNEVSASNNNDDEVVKEVEQIVTNGHHDVIDHVSPDPIDDICRKNVPVVLTNHSEESPKDCSSDSTTAHSSAVFDSLENSISEATTATSTSPPQQPEIVQAYPNLVSFENNPSKSNPVVIDNLTTASNNFDNDFVPLSEVQIVTEDSAIEAIAVEVPEEQPELKIPTEPAPDHSTIDLELPVSRQNSTAVDQDWVCVADATGLHTIIESPLLLDQSPQPEFVCEEPRSPDLAEEATEKLVFGEQLTIKELVQCSNTNLSCRIVDQQLSDIVSSPESPKTTSSQSTKTDTSCYSSVVELVQNAKTPEELMLLCDDDYFGDVARRILEERSSVQNGPQLLSETKLIEGCSFGLLNGCDVVSESNTNSAEKKSVKKKKSTTEESTTTTKTKKTKKTKKYEEKENISVNNIQTSNGFEDAICNRVEENDDDLMNVCVRELRIMYCNEANKTNGSKIAQYEEPVPASIPIKELTRSFGDLRDVPGPESPTQINGSRSGFGKFDQLTKKTVMHVRSSDPSKAQQQFSQNDTSPDSGSVCKACNKTVFAMEQIKAERAVWHKNCFRCKTCNKQLTVDVYSSHEGELFCKPHFRDLFKPKVVIEEEKPLKFKKPELIIRENQPLDLPPDVVRASDKPDLGLEELGSLNVKSRFQVFEKQPVEESTDKSPVCVKRSPSILSKLAKFQAKGMDVGVSSDIFNGIDYEESSSSDEEPVHDDNVTRNSVAKEKPVAFNKMNDVKKNWENGQTARREDRQEERRLERQNIRSRLFQGKQNKMREAYENAVAESERSNVKKDIEIRSEKARTIKEKFEKGEVLPDESDEEPDKKAVPRNEDVDVFEAGISKKSRAIFQQIDAAVKTQNNSFSSPTQVQPTQNGHRSHREVITRQVSNDVVRASDPVDEVTVETADISSRFKFFESYKAPEQKRKAFRITPPREGQLKSESPEKELPKDPNVVRCEESVENEEEVLKKSNTTAKMLSLFRQLEEAQEVVPDGLKPMKKFTPPPASSGTSSEEESEEESEEPSEASIVLDDVVRACDKTEDEYLKMAQNAAKAKALKEKFEKWEPEKQSNNNAINLLDSEQASLDTTKSLRARFESMKGEQQTDKPRPKVNRFVDNSLPGYCDTCYKKVYPLEKVEAGDKVFHRSCFKCTRCSGILRMETFTMNNGHLYCVPHFKQLFITKGNYDEGFGNDQHKAKWPVHTGVAMTNGLH
ncbi:hypothetical protein V9T40_008636 [Parthenolecanium corni]|uniref:LIM zinc-binding domain-containing protein n=1 Tax=Parthenolecanium corni TaxID=536013 RepID=A0AAN9TR01_9HEMI